MATTSIDFVICSCSSGKTVTSFCTKHHRTLCMECLLSEHKECIADIITIEEASRITNPLRDEILDKCETYKLLFERHKSKKVENLKKVEAVDKELRVTISQMRLEMIRRVNSICKNALELSVSVMAQRTSIVKSEVEALDKELEKIQTVKSIVEKHYQNDKDFSSNLEAAKKEITVIEKYFRDLKQSNKEVQIQFVVPPIVTDFMEYFHSLGEIVEEVREEGRTSVYISDTEKRDVHRRARVERSQNPFNSIKMTGSTKVLAGAEKSDEDELFVFQKGMYYQDDGNLYAFIDVQRQTDSETSSSTSSGKKELRIPPLPCRARRPKRSTGDDSTDSCYEPANENEEADVKLRDKCPANDKPIPKPRTSIGKAPKLPVADMDFDSGNKLSENTSALINDTEEINKSYLRGSTSSNESSSSRGDKSGTEIVIQGNDSDISVGPSSANVSPCLTPNIGRRNLYQLFPGSDLRKSDTAIHSKHSKRYVRIHPPLKPSTSTGQFLTPSRNIIDTQGHNTYPKSHHDSKTETVDSDSEGGASAALDEIDRDVDNLDSERSAENFIVDSELVSSEPSNGQKPPIVLSVIELESHKNDTKDVCIITSLVVTKSQLIVVCDYSHNCMQLYDRLGNRKQVYGLAKPFGSCLLSDNKIAVTSRTRSSVSLFDVEDGLLKFEKEHRLGNLVSVFGLAYSNGYICVCCLTNLAVFTEDLRPYSSVKAITTTEPKGSLRRKKLTKPVFCGVKYCTLDFSDGHNEIFVSDFKQDKVVCITVDGEVKWTQIVKAPKSVVLHQGKVYVAAKKEIMIIEAAKGLILREVHEGVPKYPWSLFVDDTTSTIFITNGSVNDVESRKIESLPLKILTTIFG